MCFFTLASGKMPVPVGKGRVCGGVCVGEGREVRGIGVKCWAMWHDGFYPFQSTSYVLSALDLCTYHSLVSVHLFTQELFVSPLLFASHYERGWTRQQSHVPSWSLPSGGKGNGEGQKVFMETNKNDHPRFVIC